jgi:hypothetical protein
MSVCRLKPTTHDTRYNESPCGGPFTQWRTAKTRHYRALVVLQHTISALPQKHRSNTACTSPPRSRTCSTNPCSSHANTEGTRNPQAALRVNSKHRSHAHAPGATRTEELPGCPVSTGCCRKADCRTSAGVCASNSHDNHLNTPRFWPLGHATLQWHRRTPRQYTPQTPHASTADEHHA